MRRRTLSRRPPIVHPRGGFTMVEVMIAAALLGFSLIVMFGFHSQAVRSNMNARRLTDCTWLAQTQMERLLTMDWMDDTSESDLTDGGSDASTQDLWDDLELPSGISSSTVPSSTSEVNVLYDTTGTEALPPLYRVTWDVESMDPTWVRLRVRCTYEDSSFDTRHGTTISSYRYMDS